jgi:D-alanyl-D-alanine carboxypeptidase/D-alanyl-D-alanine-endopeptidase (penicillin-binding protein 4)
MVRRVLTVVAALAVLGGGYVALDAYDVVPGILTTRPVALPAPERAPISTASGTATAAPGFAPDPRAAPHAPQSTAAPAPSSRRLQALLAPLAGSPALGSTSLVVRDALTGAVLLDRDGQRPRIPASTVKLLSAAAIDATTTSGTRFTTKVVDGPGQGRITLVAGGDTLLNPGKGAPTAVAGRAGLADLADEVAKQLRAQHRATVTFALDLTFGRGPALAPSWPSSYRQDGVTSAVAMLGLSTQRATQGHPGPADPTAEVARVFRELLTKRGITVTGPTRAAATAETATVLGWVASAPVRDQLDLALLESDNGLTESLTRAAAGLAGAETDFAGTTAFTKATLNRLGVDVRQVTLVDSSGLSRENRVSARALSDVLQVGVSGGLPGLAQTLEDLPVAGLSGTLADRFGGASAQGAIGVVRAKTGTLTGVQGLAGTVLTADGRVLTLVVLAEGSAPGQGTVAARAVLDRIAAVLATCGCR